MVDFHTGRYFVNWKLQKCVFDNGEYGSPAQYDDLFDSEDKCCAKIWWVDEDDMIGVSRPLAKKTKLVMGRR